MNKRNFSTLAVIILAAFTISLISACGSGKNKDMNEDLKTFISKFEEKYVPLYKQSCEAYWKSSISGKDEDFKVAADLQYEMTKMFTDAKDFATLKEIKESGSISDPLLSRQLEVLYNMYAGQQIDTTLLKKMIDMQSKIEQLNTNFRAVVGTDSITDNGVEDILHNSVDNEKLQATWEASKKVGALLSKDIVELVKLRNEAAKSLGYSNYHEMSLKLADQDPAEIEQIFDELDSLTRDAFGDLKSEMDDYFSKRYKVQKEDLKPWHYQNRFFQEAPKIYAVDLDKYYKDQDLVAVTANYYKGIGMDIDDLIKNSDLFEKEGKNQHAYCIDMDRAGDVRILCNVVPNASWMNTMLHEYGHGVYSKYNDPNVPFILRDAAHIFCTEATAMFFGRLSSNPEWMKVNIGLKEAEAAKIAVDCKNTLRLEQLVFSRWSQVMYRFEKSMYENPDQDLNMLWWDLVEKYQLVKRPKGRNEPDWASKIHIATVPCYYHNYLLGELLASQFSYYLAKNVYKTEDINSVNFSTNPEVGKFFVEKVFKPGMTFEWNDMIEKATGEKLTAKYYAKQFVN